MKKKKSYIDKTLSIFSQFERAITIALSTIIGLAIIISLIRVIGNFYNMFIVDIAAPDEISFKNYQVLFGKIMTLLISLEFLSSILKVLKTHLIKVLVQDVILITALAIARKLIIFDYEHHESMDVIALGILLLSLGMFYFFIRFERFSKSHNSAEDNSGKIINS